MPVRRRAWIRPHRPSSRLKAIPVWRGAWPKMALRSQGCDFVAFDHLTLREGGWQRTTAPTPDARRRRERAGQHGGRGFPATPAYARAGLVKKWGPGSLAVQSCGVTHSQYAALAAAGHLKSGRRARTLGEQTRPLTVGPGALLRGGWASIVGWSARSFTPEGARPRQ